MADNTLHFDLCVITGNGLEGACALQ